MILSYVIHFIEFVLAIIYIVVKWPLYEGSEFDYGAFICFEFLFIIISYCFIGSIWSTMKKACDVMDVSKQQWWYTLLSNLPWCLLTLIIFFLFGNTFGYFACLPIVIPNCVYLIYQFFQVFCKNKNVNNNDE